MEKIFLHHEVQNYVGVKYHVRAQLPDEQTPHNFQDGYCGISKLRMTVIVFVISQVLRTLNNKQSIPEMEQKILKQNPVLRSLLEEVTVLYKEPLTIAQISFAKNADRKSCSMYRRRSRHDHLACGNGMSMVTWLLNCCRINRCVFE
jgi:hypothetical protein